MKYFSSSKLLNPTKNLIVTYSKIQLENESKTDKSFNHSLHHHPSIIIMSTRATPGGTPTTSGLNPADFSKKQI